MIFVSTLILIYCLSCGKSEKVKVALFFNPSHAFYLEEQCFSVKVDGEIIVDTILATTRVDRSLLIKCFEISGATAHYFEIKINNKDTVFSINEDPGCISVFTAYDDHTKAMGMTYDLGFKRDVLGKEFKDQLLLDKLINGETGSEFDSLSANVRKDTCWCDLNFTQKAATSY